ncbi:iron/ascorbate oxidoreductase [Crepidotus variabilis]|uniref:Iron/ascorbate oxidoreductase n=1 Tax=Crepidotus variabilis TaxID=179855 RepID=A0A9P6JN13_9AGAR|nr:iron/ascorbate oxidoreductase [Crepidotus variabilis]
MSNSASQSDFASVPVLDYSLLNSANTRPRFLQQLRHALVNVGFLYLSNHPVSQNDIQRVIDYIPKLFDLRQEAKDAIRMVNSEHFLGYSRFGAEITKGSVDQREQFDFATKYVSTWKEGDPEYYRLRGPCQWPDEKLIPGFRDAFERYLEQVKALSHSFSSVVAEALGLDPEALSQFYDPLNLRQHRAKIVKYPAINGSNDQGVGPHYDAGFLTFLLQASNHEGLQVQNLAGQWINAPPIPGTFVVNIGLAFQMVTHGLARATSHRVLSPKGSAPRYSIPFFQTTRLDKPLGEDELHFPPEVLALRDARGKVAITESANFSEFASEPFGKIALISRIKSHPDVGGRHYPELFKELFPNGHEGLGTAY